MVTILSKCIMDLALARLNSTCARLSHTDLIPQQQMSDWLRKQRSQELPGPCSLPLHPLTVTPENQPAVTLVKAIAIYHASEYNQNVVFYILERYYLATLVSLQHGWEWNSYLINSTFSLACTFWSNPSCDKRNKKIFPPICMHVYIFHFSPSPLPSLFWHCTSRCCWTLFSEAAVGKQQLLCDILAARLFPGSIACPCLSP